MWEWSLLQVYPEQQWIRSGISSLLLVCSTWKTNPLSLFVCEYEDHIANLGKPFLKHLELFAIDFCFHYQFSQLSPRQWQLKLVILEQPNNFCWLCIYWVHLQKTRCQFYPIFRDPIMKSSQVHLLDRFLLQIVLSSPWRTS